MHTPLSKDQQIVNCLLALSLWAEIPPRAVNLDKWTCGTQACFGGHLATWPEFQAMGVRPRLKADDDHGAGAPVFDEQSGALESWRVAEHLFGERHIFYAKGFFPSDNEIDTHHRTIVNRLERQIERLSEHLE